MYDSAANSTASTKERSWIIRALCAPVLVMPLWAVLFVCTMRVAPRYMHLFLIKPVLYSIALAWIISPIALIVATVLCIRQRKRTSRLLPSRATWIVLGCAAIFWIFEWRILEHFAMRRLSG